MLHTLECVSFKHTHEKKTYVRTNNHAHHKHTHTHTHRQMTWHDMPLHDMTCHCMRHDITYHYITYMYITSMLENLLQDLPKSAKIIQPKNSTLAFLATFARSVRWLADSIAPWHGCRCYRCFLEAVVVIVYWVCRLEKKLWYQPSTSTPLDI